MQQVNTPPASGKIALQYGLLFGLIVTLIKVGVLATNTFVNTSSSAVGLSLILAGVDFLIGLAAFFVAGILAAKQTAKVSTGTFAGLWAGGIYGVVGFIVSMVLFFTVNLPRLQNASSIYTSSSAYQTGLVIGGVGFAIFGILLAIGFGAGLGALGGLWGKSMSLRAAEPPVPAYPAPGYSPQSYPEPYPPQPSYPAQQYSDPYNPYQNNPYQGNPSQPYPPTQRQDPNPPYYEQPH
jgi:hypothetical protein